LDKLEHTNQWLTLATNIGVIVGLVVLILEINQNTTAIENEIDASIWANSNAGLLIVDNPELAQLSVRAKTEPWESFSPIEQERIGTLWGYALDSAELQYRLRNRGGERLNADNIVFPTRLLSQDSFGAFWTQAQQSGAYPSDFVMFFNSYVSEQRR
jgi:hypothetical protein